MRRLFTATFTLLAFVTTAFAQGQDYSPGFAAGAPDEMAVFAMADGDYTVALEYAAAVDDGVVTWAPWAETTASIEHDLNGAMVLERSLGFPVDGAEGADGNTHWSYVSMYGFDRYTGMYRMMVSDNILGLPDVYEGQVAEGRLMLTNVGTPTYNNLGPDSSDQKSRLDIEGVSADSFVATWWVMPVTDIEDGVAIQDLSWVPSVRMTYTLATE